MVARGLTAEWVPLPLLSPSEKLHAGAQMLRSVFDVHTHIAQSDTTVASAVAFTPHHVYLQLCVCASVCVHAIVWVVCFKSRVSIYVFSGVLVCVHIAYHIPDLFLGQQHH